MKITLHILICASALLSFTACKEQPKTPGEKIENKVKDALDARPHEGIRDAAEDAKDKVKNAVK